MELCPTLGNLTCSAVCNLLCSRTAEHGGILPLLLRRVIEDRYERMKAGHRCGWAFDDERWNQDGGRVTPSSTSNKHDCLAAALEIRNEIFASDVVWREILTAERVGLDLPTWFAEPDVTPRERVMVISQDPKRNNGYGRGILTVSSPWAMHSVDFRHRYAIQFPFEQIFDGGRRSIYLTDCNKVFVPKEEHAPHNMVAERISPLYKAILDDEIKLFNPTTILCFGVEATKMLKPDFLAHDSQYVATLQQGNAWNYETQYGTIPCYSFTHPRRWGVDHTIYEHYHTKEAYYTSWIG